MKKRTLKIMAIAMVFALIFAFAAIPASAADPYAPVYGDNSLSFNKFLIVEDSAEIPAITFEYAIAPGTAVAATSTTPAIIAGVGTPTISTAVFPSNDTTYNTAQSGDEVTLESGEKYAKKTVNVDFRNVSFTQPGVYRYVITEDMTNTANKAVTYDTQTSGTAGTRYLDVYVEDTYDATTQKNVLRVSRYVMHETPTVVANSTEQNVSATDKSTGFVNEVTTHNITFGKEVTGNQGSKDKYFKYTLTINNAQASTTYQVDLTNAESAPTKTAATKYATMSNPASITTGSHGVVTEYFYLKDGQYITIKGLPEGFTYELSEDAEDYTSSDGISDAEGLNRAYSDPVSKTTAVTDDVYTGFTNDRTGVIPTGVLLTIAPFAIGLLLFGALAVFFVARKKRREGEDEE